MMKGATDWAPTVCEVPHEVVYITLERGLIISFKKEVPREHSDTAPLGSLRSVWLSHDSLLTAISFVFLPAILKWLL